MPAAASPSWGACGDWSGNPWSEGPALRRLPQAALDWSCGGTVNGPLRLLVFLS